MNDENIFQQNLAKEKPSYSQDVQPQAGHDPMADQAGPGLCLPPLLLRVTLQVLPPPRGRRRPRGQLRVKNDGVYRRAS